MRFILCFALVVGLAACGSSGTLTYAPTTTVQPGPPGAIADVAVTDKRDEKPNRVATIRGGYGNPVFVLDTPTPVAAQVQAAFTAAFEARGMIAPSGPYRAQLTLNTLYGDQYMGPRAEIKIDLAILDAAGRAVYVDNVSDGSAEFAFFKNGIFADIQDLRREVEKLLNRTIDRMLDKPGLAAAVSRPPPVMLSGAPGA